MLVDIMPDGRAIPESQHGVLLHAGPPMEWEEMCDPMRAAAIGALRYEGWAGTESESEALASGGEIRLEPNHHCGAVEPMTGITSPSMPGFVIENRAFDNRAFCTINEGLGRVLRFGANDDTVIERLHWIQSVLAPVLGEAVRRTGGLELKPIMARALNMGDEMHQRNVAATSLFLREIAPHIAHVTSGKAGAEEVLKFMAGNDQFFLNLAMAAAKPESTEGHRWTA